MIAAEAELLEISLPTSAKSDAGIRYRVPSGPGNSDNATELQVSRPAATQQEPSSGGSGDSLAADSDIATNLTDQNDH